MAYLWTLWLLFVSLAAAQTTAAPSNDTSEIGDAATSPRFWINATGPIQFPSFRIAPLGKYSDFSHARFLTIGYRGIIVNVNVNNVDQVQTDDFAFISCDPEEYAGSMLGVGDLLRIITDAQATKEEPCSIILYSIHSNHCNETGIDALPWISGIFTATDPAVALDVSSRNFNEQSQANVVLSPDFQSYGGGNPMYHPPPKTAIAMIILYSITGVITALFVVIIVSGAIRAHRHPERYGPRSVTGRGRQSRAKGIARAMLETLPIVKFGDNHEPPKETSPREIELAENGPVVNAEVDPSKDKSVATAARPVVTDEITLGDTVERAQNVNADGRDDSGMLGCSICTEDFQKGEEVRMLPCNHKFHPECVDPWLLNVSGTCPLCRIDLRPQDEREGDSNAAANDEMPPPLATGGSERRSQAIHHLMTFASGSREERINALRRFRHERRSRNGASGDQGEQPATTEEERRSLAGRFRERFRVRTRRHETSSAVAQTGESGV